jgi:aspartate/methionine/tyrosine aminotransferase
MTVNVFKLEEFLGCHEFSAPYLLCCSDAQTWTLDEILGLAHEDEQHLWQNLKLSYTEVKGLPRLREAIARVHYPGLTADQILCFSGAEEGIFCTLFALLEPQDHVIVVTPCYQSLLEIPRMKGCPITPVALREENQWRLNVDDIKKAVTEKTKWVIMNFPHNPTGQILLPEDQQALIRFLDERGIFLFSDEVYRLLGPKETLWVDSAASFYPRAISLGVMSKSYGLAGLRIGWVACQNEQLLLKIEQMKHYTTICNSAPSEVISLIALRCHDHLVGRNNHIVEQNLSILDHFMIQHQDRLSWVRPQGGCTGFIRYKGEETVDDFCAKVLNKTGVLLLPGSVYDEPSQHFRIGFGRQNMPQALTKFGDFLDNLT